MLMIANDATEAPTRTSSLHLAAWTARLPGQARVTPGTLGAETPAEVVTEAEQMPRRARYLVPRGLPRPAHDRYRHRVVPDHQGDPVAPVLADGSGGGRAGVDRGGWPAGRGGRLHRRTRPDRGLPDRERAPGRSPAPLHRRVPRPGELAAPAASARAAGRHGGGRPGRLADLAAHRRVGSAPGQAGPVRC